MSGTTSSGRVNALTVGARGWEHPQWWGRFYPEDMPAEWRLAYYANEFRAVLVPAGTWSSRPEEVAGWTADVPEGFEFYLEVPQALLDPARRVSAELGSRLGGWVVQPEADTPAAHVIELPRSVPPVPRVAIDAPDADRREQLARAGVEGLWRDVGWTAGETGVGLLSAEGMPSDLPALRQRIEAFLAAARGPQAVLFVDGEPPELERLRAADAIARLLGA